MKSFYPDMAGVILAGGRSSRFGYNKAFAQIDGCPFIVKIINTIKTLFADILLSTNTPELYAGLPINIIRDDEPYQGPLGGIATILRQTEHKKIFVVACDMPLIQEDDINTLIKYSEGVDASIALCGSMPAYLFAVYDKRLLGKIETYLQAGQRSLKDFCASLSNIICVPMEGPSTLNINTEEELRSLEAKYAV